MQNINSLHYFQWFGYYSIEQEIREWKRAVFCAFRKELAKINARRMWSTTYFTVESSWTGYPNLLSPLNAESKSIEPWNSYKNRSITLDASRFIYWVISASNLGRGRDLGACEKNGPFLLVGLLRSYRKIANLHLHTCKTMRIQTGLVFQNF